MEKVRPSPQYFDGIARDSADRASALADVAFQQANLLPLGEEQRRLVNDLFFAFTRATMSKMAETHALGIDTIFAIIRPVDPTNLEDPNSAPESPV